MDLTCESHAPQVRLTSETGGMLRATMDRRAEGNALDSGMIAGLHAACDQAEHDDTVRMLVIDARGPQYCSGLDFRSATKATGTEERDPRGFADLLARLAALPALAVACVERPAIAGGVGLAAACDLVIAGPNAQFRLTEAMWGLQPANIAPYLIRRMGFQRAYAMALTLRPLTAEQAMNSGLADSISTTPDAVLAELRTQSARVSRKTRAETKALFAQFWLLDENQRRLADTAMSRAISDPQVQRNLDQYLATGRFPWETTT